LLYRDIKNGELYSEIIENPHRMINVVGGYYFLETKDEPNNWYMGQLEENDEYVFWGLYGELEEALKSM